MAQLHRSDWRKKLVPVYLPGNMDNPPLLLAGLQGFTLGNDIHTVELVNGVIPVDEQLRTRQQRQRAEANFLEELRQGRLQRLNEIREVVAELREQFGENHDPTGALGQISEQLRSAVYDASGSGASQIVNVSQSASVSVGPSFHIAVHVQKDTPPSSRPGTPFSDDDFFSCSESTSAYH
ncbi:uncharacterized protein LOC134786600 [Penaeus indicus]|uniref:uncharacterized protein LOC134786600 n=1 Tax=Penaeus indicus TaxID=29960 RepID=UPI00300CB3F9